MPIDADAIRPRLITALGDQYQLRELLGAGGFAAVFRAHDPFLQRDVAIKVLDPALGVSAELEEQFLHEARIVAGVEHPHIVPLYGAESREGLLYLVMRLLPGQSLADRIAQHGALNPAEAARLALEIAGALATAHQHGVVHRDIKPDNILLDASGHATVTDFGISRLTSRPAPNAMGVTVGTPRYISPEQALGEEVDGRADLYSLGVVLFEMLTGRVPFEGRSVTELIAKHISSPPPRVAEFAPKTPTALTTLVGRLLAKDRNDRPDAAELVTLLTAATTPIALLSPGKARWRKWRFRLLLIGVAGGTAAIILWGVIRAAIGFGQLALDGGAMPIVSAVGAAIPDSLLHAARSEGSLHPGDTVLYALIPAGHSASDATLFTDSIVIVRSPDGARRLRLKDGKLDVARRKRPGAANAEGYFIVTPKGEKPDTIYRDLSGSTILAMLNTFRQITADRKRETKH